MARSDRIQVTVSPAMYCALAMLAEKNAITISTQATLTLRQVLAKTMAHPECQRRLRAHTARRNHATWAQDMVADRAVELMHEEATRGAASFAAEVEGA